MQGGVPQIRKVAATFLRDTNLSGCALQECLFMPRIERALLSVTDKTGIVRFAKRLHEIGVELISTGGMAKLLRESRIPVREVAEMEVLQIAARERRACGFACS
jgi:hypothetical protein